MLRTIATPPSPRTVSYRWSAEVHGKRAEHGTKKQLCIVGPVPSAWMCARSAPSSSLSRRSKRNMNSTNAQTTLRDTDVEHERTQTAQRWHTLCGRRRTRFVGSAAAYAMTSTHHYVMLRPAKASYACKRGLRRVKASYGPAINYM